MGSDRVRCRCRCRCRVNDACSAAVMHTTRVARTSRNTMSVVPVLPKVRDGIRVGVAMSWGRGGGRTSEEQTQNYATESNQDEVHTFPGSGMIYGSRHMLHRRRVHVYRTRCRLDPRWPGAARLDLALPAAATPSSHSGAPWPRFTQVCCRITCIMRIYHECTDTSCTQSPGSEAASHETEAPPRAPPRSCPP